MRIKNIVKIILFTISISFNANAGELQAVFDSWHVLTSTQNNNKLCYIASIPKDKEGNYKKRGEAFLLVILFQDRNPEVSISSGYPYKTGSSVKINIDAEKYSLKELQGERAWAQTEDEDKKLILSMKKNNFLTAKGTSDIGTYSIDSYSLKGFSKAFAKMNALCSPANQEKTSK
jgi:invasion protein IalB